MDTALLQRDLGDSSGDPWSTPKHSTLPSTQTGALPAALLSLAYSGEECGENASPIWRLTDHASSLSHRAFRCHLPGCTVRFITLAERDAHVRRPHLDNHGRVETAHPLACVECMQEFGSKSKLEQHANEAQHSPFKCVCGKGFARLDVLNRHLDSLGDGIPKYPCQFCKRHRGKNGFRRRDHLLQHIRGYHKFEAEGKIDDKFVSRRGKYQVPNICPHRDCQFYRADSFKELSLEEQHRTKPFKTQAEYTKRMKDAHDFTPFPCTATDCSKTGRKGYSRQKDLINHRKKEHPDAVAYVPKTRDVMFTCRHPGCGAKLGQNSIAYHMGFRHEIWMRNADQQ